uniref:Uncharacterized protein n=1 Tax=Sinocyclocheilus grahami TaxID=75366 RepID=A0A672LQG8_SINGR
IEAIIQNESDKTAPRCPHGPALLFEKTGNGEEEGRRFYWADEMILACLFMGDTTTHQNLSYVHICFFDRFRAFVSLPLEQRRLCVDCQLLILPGESANHAKHKALSEDITVQRLKRPSGQKEE